MAFADKPLREYVWDRSTAARRAGVRGTGPARAAFLAALATLAATGVVAGREPPRANLAGRAVLPADTFHDGPPSGSAVPGPVNGRATPFASQPVQGVSGLVARGSDRWLALADNGFGAKANSADALLKWMVLRVDFASGAVEVVRVTPMSDPDRRAPFDLAHPGGNRPLSGADFDPEAIVPAADGTFWIGDEFGPYLLHVDAAGRLLEPPLDVPIPPPLAAFARLDSVLRSPDHPALAALPDSFRVARAAVPRSGGFESMAADAAGTRLLAMLEKPLADDPVRRRRWAFEFSLSGRAFTGRCWSYRVEEPSHAVRDMAILPDGTWLVVEGDGEEGAAARFKRIFRVDPGRSDIEGFASKSPVADLLAIDDATGITHAEPGAIGLGPAFTMPFVTIESIAVVDDSTLLVANDNNYPFSAGRRPGVPDDTEFVLLRLARPLAARR